MTTQWTTICQLNDIAPNTGVCAKVGPHQVAIFRQAHSDQLFAVDNYDPIGRANVLSRGLLAQLGEHVTVASPLYKQHYSLLDGSCLENKDVKIPVYSVRINDGKVEVSTAAMTA